MQINTAYRNNTRATSAIVRRFLIIIVTFERQRIAQVDWKGLFTCAAIYGSGMSHAIFVLVLYRPREGLPCHGRSKVLFDSSMQPQHDFVLVERPLSSINIKLFHYINVREPDQLILGKRNCESCSG